MSPFTPHPYIQLPSNSFIMTLTLMYMHSLYSTPISLVCIWNCAI